MLYIIIILAILLIIAKLGKHILFNPRVNSAISILYFVYIIIAGKVPAVVRMLLVISIIDCIRDIRIAKWRYDDLEYGIDSFYLIKSLSSIFTIGLSRIVFFIIDCPYAYLWEMTDIKKKMNLGYPLKEFRSYWMAAPLIRSKNYYYNKHIAKLYKQGKVISNGETVKREFEISKEKYIGNHIEPRKETKKKLKQFRSFRREHSHMYYELAALSEIPEFTPAYLSAKFYKKYPKRIAEVMLTKGTVSPETIKGFEELKDLNLTMSLDGSNRWSEPFIIMALEELVADGIVEDLNLSDEVVINHAYRHMGSKVEMKRIDLNDLLGDDVI